MTLENALNELEDDSVMVEALGEKFIDWYVNRFLNTPEYSMYSCYQKWQKSADLNPLWHHTPAAHPR